MKQTWFAKCAGAIVAIALVMGCENVDPQQPTPNPIDDSAELIQVLAATYRAMDYPTFATLFCDGFMFVLDMPNPDTQETQWDLETELRIHRRMFEPRNIPPGEPPLPPEFWLQSVTITLTPQTSFVERPDLYTNSSPPGPLDPALWIARSATYGTDVFFQLAGETDYQIVGRADFTVLEDRNKQIGDPGKFCIYRWEDLGTTTKVIRSSAKADGRSAAAGIERGTWTGIKALYA